MVNTVKYIYISTVKKNGHPRKKREEQVDHLVVS